MAIIRGDVMYEGIVGPPISIRKTTMFPPHRVPESTYDITIIGYEFTATETKTCTASDLDKYVDDLLSEGYSHQPTPTTRVIYPSHVIYKIKVEKHKD